MSRDRLRRSAIEDAAHCLWRYKQLWIDGVPDQSDFSLRGIGYHVVKYFYVRKLWERKLPHDLDTAREAFVEGIAEAKTPPHLIPEIRWLFEKHVEWFALDINRFLTAEERQHSDDGSWAPDLVYAGDRELEIVDDKTYWVGMTEDQVRALFQSRFYIARAMERWPGFERYRFTMNWVRLSQQTSVVFEKSDVDGIQREVAAVIAALEDAARTNSWPAAAGPQCGFCELACPLERKGLSMPIRCATPAEARELAEIVHVTETRNKLRKKTLKRWSIANGPIDLQGLVFDHRPVQSISYPMDKVIEVLTARQLPTAPLRVSSTTLKPMFKLQPSLRVDLAMYEQTKTRHQFAAKKVVAGRPVQEIGDGDVSDEEDGDDA